MEQQKKKKGNCRNGREEKVQYETLNKRTPKKRHGGKKKKEKMNVKMRKGAKVDGGCKNGKPRGRSLVINDVLALEHRFFFLLLLLLLLFPSKQTSSLVGYSNSVISSQGLESKRSPSSLAKDKFLFSSVKKKKS